MLSYIIRRLFLIIPTLLGVMIVNFAIVQFAPGGPVEQAIAEIRGVAVDSTARFTGGGSENMQDTMHNGEGDSSSSYRGAQGLDPEFIAELERLYGFDKPPMERFLHMMGNYMRLDFGVSYNKDQPVIDLIWQAMPVSISLGLWSTLIIYLVSIPLGIKKAVKDGSRFDIWTSGAVIIGFAVPGFLFAIALIILFASDRYFSIFPLSGLVSEGWEDMSWWMQILDYFHHMALPVLSLVIGGFAGLTMLTKNSFLDEINKQYVLTARAKGLSEKKVLYGHVFRNAMLIVIAGFPAAFIGMLFTGSLLIEVIFSLNGLGLLGYTAVIERDYPIVFGTLFVFTLMGLLLNLITDLTYVWVDPRIDFEGRAA